MKIHSLKKNKGFNRSKIRVWRWNSSGKGNYSGKWHKGQKARSGYSRKAWFEWGQTPLHMRLPKSKGFKRHYKFTVDTQVLNVSDLEKCTAFSSWDTITPDLLVLNGIVRKAERFKVLWNGVLAKSLIFEDDLFVFSASALLKIESAWGSISSS